MTTLIPTSLVPTTVPPYIEELDLESVITFEVRAHGDISW